MPIRAVFFDVGETLVDETRRWALWADYLGVPRFTFAAVLGAVIREGRHHSEAFARFDPAFDLSAARADLKARGETFEIEPGDLYPDALPCLAGLKATGLRVGVAGNQPEGCEAALRAAGVEADVLASSYAWGVEKPSAAFFAKLVEAAGLPAAEIAYVGDRLDNDIGPAAAAGLKAIFIRRGPWAHILDAPETERVAAARVTSLVELPHVVQRL